MEAAATDCYRKNLAALAALQPDAAALVDTVSIPPSISSAIGRDGSRTFVRRDDNGRLTWFGGSSMPTISAAEMLHGFTSDGRNVCLPGMLTGLECRLLAERVPGHAAVFVVEEDPLAIKLAFHLHDYTELLSAGRMVCFITDVEGLTRWVSDFLQRFPGYEPPSRILTVPQRSSAWLNELKQQWERAGVAAARSQAELVSKSVERLRTRSIEVIPIKPRVAVIGFDPRADSLELSQRLVRAMGRIGWVSATCVPDAPGKCHVAARLLAIEQVRADLVIVVNGLTGAIDPLLPAGLPVLSWMWATQGVGTPCRQKEASIRGVVAPNTSMMLALQKLGCEETSLALCAPAADEALFQSHGPAEQLTPARVEDVAVLGDVPDDRAEWCGVTLPSHLSLWSALRAVAGRLSRGEHPIDAEGLLARAEGESGTRLTEPGVRRHFLELILSQIIPAATMTATAATLIDSGLRVKFWGTNWGSQSAANGLHQGAVPVGKALNDLFQSTRLVVLGNQSVLAVQTALDALAAGAFVVIRGSQESFTSEYPPLAEVSPFLRFFCNAVELMEAVGGLGRGGNGRALRNEEGMLLVRSRHTMGARLVGLVEWLRSKQVELTSVAPKDQRCHAVSAAN